MLGLHCRQNNINNNYRGTLSVMSFEIQLSPEGYVLKMASMASVVMLYLALLQPSNCTCTSAYNYYSQVESHSHTKSHDRATVPRMLRVDQSPALPPLPWLFDL